tara:strand:+ start:17 stop:319 length:303 start_codon:yes stop_codon:yes gene_type:complete
MKIKDTIATSKVQIDNKSVRITEYNFNPGSETKFHKHEMDYIVVPINDGELLLVDKFGKKVKSTLKKGVSYFKEAGIEHNVINVGIKNLKFIEIEIKNRS